MYAFVAIDIASGEFLAARDPFGVKPLYVIQSADSFLFFSEMKPLLQTVPTGDVLLVPPGYMVSGRGCERTSRLSTRAPICPFKIISHMLDAILAEAVRVRLPPDLPVATLFSGGIDSTLVAHYVRQHRSDAPAYFVGNTKAPDYPFAAEYADRVGLDLRVVPSSPTARTSSR